MGTVSASEVDRAVLKLRYEETALRNMKYVDCANAVGQAAELLVRLKPTLRKRLFGIF